MNEQALFVLCPDCATEFRVLFNGEETVRCPNRECSVYLFMSERAQKEAQEAQAHNNARYCGIEDHQPPDQAEVLTINQG